LLIALIGVVRVIAGGNVLLLGRTAAVLLLLLVVVRHLQLLLRAFTFLSAQVSRQNSIKLAEETTRNDWNCRTTLSGPVDDSDKI
jgi:hypothetical protein